MHGETISIVCLNCSSPFVMSRAIAEKRDRRFCTVACSSEYRKRATAAAKPTYTCKQCGKSFQRKYERKEIPQFCSMACNGASRTGARRAAARELRTGSCRICGEQFTTRNPAKLYCSTACQQQRATKPSADCEYCGTQFVPRTASSRFCSRPCLHAGSRRERSASWKGGRYITGDGYVKVYEPEHPGADSMGYVSEHRLVMERKLGRPLTSKETVHHKNNTRDDNRPENLQLRQGRHGKGAAYQCLDCGSHNVGSIDI
jgi:hypothetical protein